jgi:hypothetical protein
VFPLEAPSSVPWLPGGCTAFEEGAADGVSAGELLAVFAGAEVCEVLLPHPPVVAKAQSAKAKNLVFRFMNFPINSIGDRCCKLPLEGARCAQGLCFRLLSWKTAIIGHPEVVVYGLVGYIRKDHKPLLLRKDFPSASNTQSDRFSNTLCLPG